MASRILVYVHVGVLFTIHSFRYPLSVMKDITANKCRILGQFIRNLINDLSPRTCCLGLLVLNKPDGVRKTGFKSLLSPTQAISSHVSEKNLSERQTITGFYGHYA